MSKAAFVYITNCDRRFVKFTENAIRFAKRNCPGIPCYVLTDKPGLKPRGCDGSFLISDVLREYGFGVAKNIGRFHAIVYGKLVIPFVPQLERFDRIICYDPDTIIVSERVRDLVEMKFDPGSVIGACPDCPPDIERHQKRIDGTGLKFCINDGYFGGGLVVFDAVKARSEEYANTIRRCVSQIKAYDFKYQEQDILNLNFKLTAISNKYDRLIPLGSWHDRWKGEFALHFPGMRKKKTLDRVCEGPVFGFNSEGEEI